jgi:signal transduction histidine kinase
MENLKSNNKGQVKWLGSLQFRLFLIFCVFMAVLSIAVVVIVKENVKNRVYDSTRAYIIEKGYSVANRIGQQVTDIEGVAYSMACIVTAAPADAEFLHRLIPELLEGDDIDSIIAGGGVWPEPYRFDPEVERNSFFWGRQGDGQLVFYDDYNSKEGSGYHHEEWYVPAKYHRDGQVYWSQSYTDPYSLEPMVTCTIPYFKDGVFSGVVTVDVKLQGLYAMFEEEAKEFSGYIFAVDRNNRFLSYPRKDLARFESVPNHPESLTYMTVEKMRNSDTRFTQFSDLLNGLNESSFASAADTPEVAALAEILAKESYQIDLEYARIISREAMDLQSERYKVTLQEDFINDDDSVLNRSSFNIVFDIASTHWKLSVVAPLDLLVLPTQEFVDGLVVPLLLVALVCLFGAMLTTHQILIVPIKRVTDQISGRSDGAETQTSMIIYDHQDELGHLVDRFNQRSMSLVLARQQAESALVAKREFIANISHEIRTPMGGVLLAAEILAKQDIPEESLQYAQIIEQSSNSLLMIINEILDSSKLESHKIQLDPVDFSLGELTSEVSDLFKASALRKDLNFQIICSAGMPNRFHSDVTRLRQIIINLVGNAIKFTASGYVRLEFDYLAPQERLFFMVRDSGIGISASAIGRIFEEFTQANSSITRDFGGTGLGLSICKKLTELMGGEISVESTLGRSTCFTVSLPMPLAAPPFVPAVVGVKSTGTGEFSGRLLLVDDNPVNQKLETYIFKQLGFEVTTVGDGQQAVDAFSENGFDLIFMDLQMPVLDGISATKQIRAMDHPNRNVSIIALSASVGLEIKEECLACGMQGFLGKPIRRAELNEELRRVLGLVK